MSNPKPFRDRWIMIVAITATAGIAGATLSLQDAVKKTGQPRGALGHPTATMGFRFPAGHRWNDNDRRADARPTAQ